jgi:hypothetical protein
MANGTKHPGILQELKASEDSSKSYASSAADIKQRSTNLAQPSIRIRGLARVKI